MTFSSLMRSKTQQSWSGVVSIATLNGIPVPASSASLGYYGSYRAERLPANLLQAQHHSLVPTPMSAPTSPKARCSTRNGLK